MDHYSRDMSVMGLRLSVLACGVLAAAATAGGCRDRSGAWVEIAGRRWHVRLATNQAQWRTGLAGVKELRQDEGMLFVFDKPEVQEFWMRECVIPLDLAFIDAEGRVVRTVTMAVEPAGTAELRLYSSDVPVLYALEVSAGGLEAAGARPGDVVNFSPEVRRAIKAAHGR